ncbi:hypothetical protein VTL71DRAFT_8902 [Oculimacula yallundae]|uniref:Uncharacterized protein n=1 Tax=Oculimacula yallundae TaxID=86028 RepID=A0ABR4BT80_9HELO
MSPERKEAWEAIKEKGCDMFAPDRGGSYAVFDQRPLHRDLAMYCVQDVSCMPDLWNVYSQKLPNPNWPGHSKTDWRRAIKTATKARIKDAQSVAYDPRSRTKVFAPNWTKVVYDPFDSDHDYDYEYEWDDCRETGADHEGIDDSD